jgi:hypothetical protein
MGEKPSNDQTTKIIENYTCSPFRQRIPTNGNLGNIGRPRMPVLTHDTPPPPNWPPNVTYITRYKLSPTFNRKHLPLLTDPSNASSPPAKPQAQSHPFPKDLVKIKRITQDGHPAKGQLGLVAMKKLEPKSKVLDYVGVVHSRPHEESDYDISLIRQLGPDLSPSLEDSNQSAVQVEQEIIDIGIDAAISGNAARFINDYRGIASRPNCEFREERDGNGWLGIQVWTLGQGVGKGEELCVSYGKGFWAGRRG